MSADASESNPPDASWQRYSRQMLFAPIGEAGQRKLSTSNVTLIGCGALGSVLADILVRAGVGRIRICDRDFVEYDNLQRQVLFDENDVTDGLPKAEAAHRKLARINSQVQIEAVVTDVNPANVETFVAGADLILDGTDNFETRYLINDVAVKSGSPWVYGAAVAETGLCLPILPGETPCLRCLFEDAPPPEMSPTCDTVGVLGPLIHQVAGTQAVEALKILTGHREAVNRHLVSIDAWSGRVTNVNVAGVRDRSDCICCKRHRYEYLSGDRIGSATNLCGRDAVQVNRKGDRPVDLAALAEKLKSVADGQVRANAYLVKVRIGEHELTVFADGRAIIQGTRDPDAAKVVYAKYVGA